MILMLPMRMMSWKSFSAFQGKLQRYICSNTSHLFYDMSYEQNTYSVGTSDQIVNISQAVPEEAAKEDTEVRLAIDLVYPQSKSYAKQFLSRTLFKLNLFVEITNF